ncbi:hypothetical protein HN385_02250 [archaeon]|jgi:hypothetical protein|nr:hypothetical protein [archaeon]MBT3450376.1 hypothetical protein [archaeon]MBT6868849.1 hypothetical protein [archaeon]MBT7192930.1 hypothetical protein [archaeon]MBT7380896.1 hypothetical protein [archaeon]
MVEALERMLELVPKIGTTREYNTIDILTSGYSQMDCGKCGFFCHHDRYHMDQSDFGQIKPTPIGGVIPYGNLTELGGDVHDTFKNDRYDNIYGGHTTIKLPEVKPLRIPWKDD